MSKIMIFDPAMCCPSGMCGVSIDPEIIRVATTLHTIRKNGVEIKRYNLSSNPMEFVNHSEVNRYLNERGVECLPLTVVDDQVVLSGRYPTDLEMVKMVGLSESILRELPKALNVLSR
ncbi:MAG: arsenical resistance operon transcriptional repressor ArsD [Firmicutes bacterium HGW-Firmicutes-19]|jgi:hypothetical protein|nr:MAG: arsenical resistance operon transcriptional repressor ArsD [Firmicutes bacterium HGW-Firmicutes-19]